MACGPGPEPEGYDGDITGGIMAALILFYLGGLALDVIHNLLVMFTGWQAW